MSTQLAPQDAGRESYRRFRLSESFIDHYKTKPVPWGFGDLSLVTYKRTYARKLDPNNPNSPTESWWQTCRRVIEGMFNKQKQHCQMAGLPWNNDKARRSAKEAYDRLFDLKWTPPGRGLWMMGTDFLDNRTGMAAFNCGFASTAYLDREFEKPFCWTMDALMLGVGVGFDTKGAGLIQITHPQVSPEKFVVPDTREGWVEAVRRRLNAFFQGGILQAYDYTQVRPKGTPIKGFGGTASGPGPLIKLIDKIDQMMINNIGRPITSTIIVDLMNRIGECVVAGNVRRSAELAIGDPNDLDYLLLKDPEVNSERLMSHGWCSNNSIECTVGMDYSSAANRTFKNGEPGYIWLELARRYGRLKDGIRLDDLKVMGFNPCVEQQLEHYELCCLVETFPARHDNFEDYMRTLKFAYMYAKTTTLYNTHWQETNQVMFKNRRVGLSQSGIVQAMTKFGRREMLNWSDKAYEYIRELDEIYSDWLTVPRAKRLTSIKPSGTVSLLAGATPGIHFPLGGKHYIRRVRMANDHELVPLLQAAGYPCEAVVGQEDTTVVFEFPMRQEYVSRTQSDVSMWEQLEMAAQYQYWWADNSVSVTVSFDPETEGPQIQHALQLYEGRLKAVSFLPRFDGGAYPQMPYEDITEEQYNKRAASLLPLDLSSLSDDGVGEKYCDSDHCVI